MWRRNKPSLKLVDYGVKIWFRLSQMCLFGVWLSHKALQSVCKRIWYNFFYFFFPRPFSPSVDKWTSLSVVSSDLSGEGLPGLLYVKLEHISAVAWFISKFNSSIRFLMTYSSDRAGQDSNTKAAAVFKHITSYLCDNGWDAVGVLRTLSHSFLLYVRRYGSGAGALRVTVSLQITLRGKTLRSSLYVREN